MINSMPSDCDLSFTIHEASIVVIRSPIDTPVHTAFGTMLDRPALFLLLHDTRGNTGIGEVWCNFPSCGAEHRQQLLDTTILQALVGHEFSDPVQCFNQLQQRFQHLAVQTGEPGPIAQCIAGIDIALWDLIAKRMQLPLHKLLGSNKATINAYASGINPTGAYDSFIKCRDGGYNAFKLKIGFGDDIDYPNLERICATLASGEQLMVDANQAWSLDEALQQVQRLSDYPLTWIEEPIMANSKEQDWQALANASSIPLAAGENLLDEQAFANANRSDWLTVMQPDVCKWGGVSGVLPVAKDAMNHQKNYCPHFLGGGIGLMASAQLLAAAGGSGLLEIDSNPNPLREDLYNPTLENGCITLSDSPGLGISVDQLASLQSKSSLTVKTRTVNTKSYG